MINRIVKAVMLSGVMALGVMLAGAGCGTTAPSSDPGQPSASETSSELGAASQTCDAFCKNEGGQLYISFPAFTEQTCNQKGGDWYTADQGYMGPPPGCCCKCGLLSGQCL